MVLSDLSRRGATLVAYGCTVEVVAKVAFGNCVAHDPTLPSDGQFCRIARRGSPRNDVVIYFVEVSS
jgi:hypothetical protein